MLFGFLDFLMALSAIEAWTESPIEPPLPGDTMFLLGWQPAVIDSTMLKTFELKLSGASIDYLLDDIEVTDLFVIL